MLLFLIPLGLLYLGIPVNYLYFTFAIPILAVVSYIYFKKTKNPIYKYYYRFMFLVTLPILLRILGIPSDIGRISGVVSWIVIIKIYLDYSKTKKNNNLLESSDGK